MTQQIEQLATARLGFEIQKIVSSADRQDLDQRLWYAHNETHWSTGGVITDHEKEQIFATEMILSLGQRSIQLMYREAPKRDLTKNPLYSEVNEKLSNILIPAPADDDNFHVLNAGYVLKLNEHDLDQNINDIFEKVPEYMGEYWVKRCLALEVYRTDLRYNFSDKTKREKLDTALSTVDKARSAMSSIYQ